VFGPSILQRWTGGLASEIVAVEQSLSCAPRWGGRKQARCATVEPPLSFARGQDLRVTAVELLVIKVLVAAEDVVAQKGDPKGKGWSHDLIDINYVTSGSCLVSRLLAHHSGSQARHNFTTLNWVGVLLQ